MLFEPYKLGSYELPHRVVMAPLTRSRSRQPGNVPHALNACYYRQRASAAFIITEATQVSQQGQGYAWTPGIHTSDQVEGWRLVTDVVHAESGRIFLQVWHVGRISHPSLQPDGQLPVAPSALKPTGQAFIENENGEGALVPFVTPRALQTMEMPYIVEQYVHGASNALAAGFDGVEIHAANGYLLDQFINSSTNERDDEYGGTTENRARLLLEVLDAVCRVWPPDKVGVRISPLGTFNDMGDEHPEETFSYVAERLGKFGLAYLHVVRPEGDAGPARNEKVRILDRIRERFPGTLIVAGGFEKDEAREYIREHKADLVAFGRKFLSNPDLPQRFKESAALNSDDPTTYYGGGERGYTDYPSLAQERGDEPCGCVDDTAFDAGGPCK